MVHFFQRTCIFDQDPMFGPLPTPTMTDIGVASPKAQGQATISTASALAKPNAKEAEGTQSHQVRNVKIAIMMTIGTNISDTLSVNR
jgi:hypothetical protein